MKDHSIKSAQAASASRPTRIIQSPYEQIAAFKGGVFHFNFQKSVLWMEEKGKMLFGDNFAIAPADLNLIYKLLIYAIGDKENAERLGLNLRKGLLISGPIGCGKSSLARLISYFCPREKQFMVKPTREISFEFEKNGYSVINHYSKGSYFRIGGLPVPKVYCFDDLGLEQTPKHFGNECNVMAEILLARYDLFVAKRMLTHLTTNLSASELEAIYGNRIRSRMREMFNLVAFDKAAKDKRV
ncbi:ATPase [Sunxiuqinia rutila]|uniref:ATPase n=1 Tax=Sunxiuqinia rutila TaxID=1397841 RepID=UPI003D35C154